MKYYISWLLILKYLYYFIVAYMCILYKNCISTSILPILSQIHSGTHSRSNYLKKYDILYFPTFRTGYTSLLILLDRAVKIYISNEKEVALLGFTVLWQRLSLIQDKYCFLVSRSVNWRAQYSLTLLYCQEPKHVVILDLKERCFLQKFPGLLPPF